MSEGRQLIRYANSINQALDSLLMSDDGVVLLGEDIKDPYGGAFKVTKGLSTKYPNKVISMPISEAGITGLSIGLALNGLKPILEIMFGDFITLCADQIINGASKFRWMYGDNIKLPIVIRTPMGGYRGFGPTHSQTLESIFFGTPNIKIIAPSIFHHPGELLSHIVEESNCLTLFIENKSLYPEYLKLPGVDNKIDNFHVRQLGEQNNYPVLSLCIEDPNAADVVLICYGGISLTAAKCALNVYLEDEIIVNVLILSLIKPLIIDDIIDVVKNTKKVIILEESVKEGGFGSELSARLYEIVFDELTKPIVSIGARSCPIPNAKHLENLILPNEYQIETSLREITNG
jgi:pyruvate/2-oxoglutarate/acetoin dehydrogenase E1 component